MEGNFNNAPQNQPGWQGNFQYIMDPDADWWPIGQERNDYAFPVLAGITNYINMRDEWKGFAYEKFINFDTIEGTNEEKAAYRKEVTQNRQRLMRAISESFRFHEIPIKNMEGEEDSDNVIMEITAPKSNNYVVYVDLDGDYFKRVNPALKKFGTFPPRIRFVFNEYGGSRLPQVHEWVEVRDVNPSKYRELLQPIDDVFTIYATMYQRNNNLALRGKNMMNMAKNRAHRKMVERVLTQKVGDPSFAWYMSKFNTTIPRRAVHPEIKNIKANLFKARKTRKGSRKNRKARTRKA